MQQLFKHFNVMSRLSAPLIRRELNRKFFGEIFRSSWTGNSFAERIRNAITIGSNDGTYRGNKITCVVHEDRLSLSSKVISNADGIEFRGDVHDLMGRMQQDVSDFIG